MSRGRTLRRYAGIAGAAVGAVAAGAVGGVLAERRVVARRRLPPEVPLGSLRGTRRTVIADDGLELYAEVDEVRDFPGAGREDGSDPAEPADQGDRGDSADAVGSPTIVFAHGYSLNLDCWHFQRAALRGRYRMVFYDQRSHGRSGRSRSEHCTVDQLGRDLAAVLDTLVPDQPAVLVGHSMGGMTVMALAEQRPEWFGPRVAAVALVSTSAGGLNATTLGLPGIPGRVLHKLTPALMATLARAPRLVESGRRAGSDLGFVVTRRLGFGGPVPQEYVDFADEMLSSTPIEVVADFFPGFDTHDKLAALPALADVGTLVIGGTRDLITPIHHSRRIADALPRAELVELPGAGHLVMLECHDQVSRAIADLAGKVSL